MKHALPLLLCLTACSDNQAPKQVDVSQPEKLVTCPKITASTPWNLEAKRGVDFWTCTYTYAATGEPLLEAMISNHPGKPPLELFAFYPDGSSDLWLQEVTDSPTKTRTYRSYRPTGSRPMSILVISFTASDSAEFKEKALIASSLEL